MVEWRERGDLQVSVGGVQRGVPTGERWWWSGERGGLQVSVGGGVERGVPTGERWWWSDGP